MTKEEIFIQLFDKIPLNAKLGIYGLNPLAGSIYYDIKQKRIDINFCCFIDHTEREAFEGQKVSSLKDCLDNKLCDFIINTNTGDCFIENILDVYGIPFINVNGYIADYYQGKHTILSDETYKKVMAIYDTDADKNLFDMVFKRRKRLENDRFLAQQYYQSYTQNITVGRTIRYQYLEKINKEKIKIVLDLGFNCGFNAIAYNKLLPNLQKIYGFEAIYNNCRNEFIEQFIPKEKLNIVNALVGEKKQKAEFYINLNNVNASLAKSANSFADKNITSDSHKIIEVDMITIDDYCSRNNIKPDFIKMDIEGSELLALKGGIKTITNYRPQLAISIYHCDEDFINIPIYLSENLENYIYRLGHYSPDINETVLYALPKELTE